MTDQVRYWINDGYLETLTGGLGSDTPEEAIAVYLGDQPEPRYMNQYVSPNLRAVIDKLSAPGFEPMTVHRYDLDDRGAIKHRTAVCYSPERLDHHLRTGWWGTKDAALDALEEAYVQQARLHINQFRVRELNHV